MFEVHKNKGRSNKRRRKKKLANFSIDLRSTYAKFPDATLEEIINIAFYEGTRSNVDRILKNHT